MRIPERSKVPAVSLPGNSHQPRTGEEHAKELLGDGVDINQARDTLQTIGYIVEINDKAEPPELCVSSKVRVDITGRGGYIPRTTCIAWNQ